MSKSKLIFLMISDCFNSTSCYYNEMLTSNLNVNVFYTIYNWKNSVCYLNYLNYLNFTKKWKIKKNK
jgi:hypothetical protein